MLRAFTCVRPLTHSCLFLCLSRSFAAARERPARGAPEARREGARAGAGGGAAPGGGRVKERSSGRGGPRPTAAAGCCLPRDDQCMRIRSDDCGISAGIYVTLLCSAHYAATCGLQLISSRSSGEQQKEAAAASSEPDQPGSQEARSCCCCRSRAVRERPPQRSEPAGSKKKKSKSRQMCTQKIAATPAGRRIIDSRDGGNSSPVLMPCVPHVCPSSFIIDRPKNDHHHHVTTDEQPTSPLACTIKSIAFPVAPHR